MGNLTKEQANELLKNAKTKQDLIYIVKNLIVESEVSKTILYSGNDKS
jgi:hypothetical protein